MGKNSKISQIYNNNSYFAAGLILIFSILFLILEVYNGRFWQSDFTVYYKSASRIISGENLFGIVEDGHYVFKYSPFSAVIFIPFTIFPLFIAKYIYWFFYTGIIITGFYLSVKLATQSEYLSKSKINSTILLGSLILVVHFQRELHLGQVNQLLLVMYLLITAAILNNKPQYSGAILAASILIKPFGLIFIPYFIVKRRFKDLLWLVLFLLLFFFIPLLFYSVDEFKLQNILWLNELAVELGNKQSLLLPANHTIFSVIARSTPLSYIATTPIFVKIYQLIILMLLGISILFFIKKDKGIENNTVAEMALLISLIPLLSFTSQNAFGFVGLVVFILLVNYPKFSIFDKILCIVGFIFLGGNYYDIWGSYLSGLFNDISLVSYGTIILLGLLAKLRSKKLV